MLLATASWFDATQRRIPNALVVVVLATGLAVTLATRGLAAGGMALVFVLVGLAVWLPFYAFRMLGAGDVKLFAACCAWFASFTQVYQAAVASAIVGGALAILWAIAQRRFISVAGGVLTRVRFGVPLIVEAQRAKLPYGIPMAIGILWSFMRVQT